MAADGARKDAGRRPCVRRPDPADALADSGRGLAPVAAPTGGAILCPNHVSFLDSAFLMMTVPRRISFVGKAEYMDSWKTKYLFPAMGMIPIDRSGGGSSAGGAQRGSRRVLARGELFGIFPEGTRSRDGLLHKGHTGAARLALGTGCPIFPVGVIGTADIQPPDAKVPKLLKSARSASGGRSTTSHYKSERRPPGLRADHRRGDVRDPGADRAGVHRPVHDQEGRESPTDVAKVRLGEQSEQERASPAPANNRPGGSEVADRLAVHG